MLASYIPLKIAGWVFRKVVVTLAGKSIGKGLRRGKGAGRNNKNSSDKTNRLIDAALVGGKTTVDALAKKPGIQASLDSMKMRLTTGKAEKHEIIDEVNKNADKIIALLNSKAVHIKRLAVDGVPGSGKSTLARALAVKLNFELQTLDYIDLNKPQDFSKEQTIYEHHRLLRTQDIDNFDAIIYIDEPGTLSCVLPAPKPVSLMLFEISLPVIFKKDIRPRTPKPKIHITVIIDIPETRRNTLLPQRTPVGKLSRPVVFP